MLVAPLRRLCLVPALWFGLGLFQFLVFFLFVGGNDFWQRGQASLAGMFVPFTLLLALLLPLLWWNLWGALDTGTFRGWLLGLPGNGWRFFAARLLAALAGLLILHALTLPAALMLLWLGDPDPVLLLWNYICSLWLGLSALGIAVGVMSVFGARPVGRTLVILLLFTVAIHGLFGLQGSLFPFAANLEWSGALQDLYYGSDSSAILPWTGTIGLTCLILGIFNIFGDPPWRRLLKREKPA